MKKVYVCLLAIAVSVSAFAQKMTYDGQLKSEVKSERLLPIKPMNDATKATIDTAGWSASSPRLPLFNTGASLTIMGMSDGAGNHDGYWFGTNGTSTSDTSADLWAQAWTNFANVKISGILFLTGGKYNLSGSTSSTATFYVQRMLPYVAGSHGCIIGAGPTFGDSPAGAVLGQGSININDFDTAWGTFNYIPITLTPTISSDFCVVANFKGMRSNGDTAFMVCDAQGSGLAMNYTQYCIDTNLYYWVSALYTSAANLDRNMSVFAIVDDGAGISDEGYFNGFKMSFRQNPVVDNLVIDYATESNTNINIMLIDRNGRTVMTKNQGNQAAGQYSLNLDMSQYSAGTYFVILTGSHGGRLTKQVVVE
jgi:hypothetical protein